MFALFLDEPKCWRTRLLRVFVMSQVRSSVYTGWALHSSKDERLTLVWNGIGPIGERNKLWAGDLGYHVEVKYLQWPKWVCHTVHLHFNCASLLWYSWIDACKSVCVLAPDSYSTDLRVEYAAQLVNTVWDTCKQTAWSGSLRSELQANVFYNNSKIMFTVLVSMKNAVHSSHRKHFMP